ncbi:MAG: hypothetical protein ABWY63_01715 [Hyphomicrobiaceae bacterium]
MTIGDRFIPAEPRIATIDNQVGLPPKPLPIHVAIVDSHGRPTSEYHQWLMKVHLWRLRFFKWQGGTVPPDTPLLPPI